MTDLEMRVEALTRCVPRADFEAALAMVKNTNPVARSTFAIPTDSTEELICDLLVEIGIPESIKGHRYLVTGLTMVVKNRNLLDAITKELYPGIAEVHGTTPPRAERAMRHAIEVGWNRADFEVLNKYFGNTVSPSKGQPTNSEFMARVSSVICKKLRGGNV